MRPLDGICITVDWATQGHRMPSENINLVRYVAELAKSGFAIFSSVVPNGVIDEVLTELEHLEESTSSRRGHTYAARNLLETSPAVAALAQSRRIRALVDPVLGDKAFAIRAILFDKLPAANWAVGWHQDQFIPVAEQKDVDGFTAWSVKNGVPHVRPPTSVLENMLTLRIHLDDCTVSNGALRVIPGSHTVGLYREADISEAVAKSAPITCEMKRGSVLVMRSLLLHASGRAATPHHRRVIHVEFAADALPGGLDWKRWREWL